MRKLLLIAWCLISTSSKGQQSLAENSQKTKTPDLQSEKIFSISDKMAAFPGGAQGWEKYIRKNLDVSIPLKNNAPRGKYNVIVTFIIDHKGNTSEIKTLTNHGYGMEDEAVRLIKNGPRWVPALQKGKAVSSYRKQPLTFHVR